MARKPLRLSAPGVEPRFAESPAPKPVPGDSAAVEAAVALHIAQSEPALAAATLLPLLDAASAAGHGPSRLAAALLRATEPPPMTVAQPDQQLAAAVDRLTALLRQQDAQTARLLDMLDGLL